MKTQRLEFDQMDEIVGESGSQGEGCLMSLVKPVAVLALVAAAVLTPGAAQAGLVPRRPICAPTVVPNVVGMVVPKATRTLGETGFTYHVNPTRGQWGLMRVQMTLPTGGVWANPCTTVVEVWRGR